MQKNFTLSVLNIIQPFYFGLNVCMTIFGIAYMVK